jgi:hypothetical protein
MIKKSYQFLLQFLWGGMIFAIPITSMPLVAALISPGTTVASPAGIILLLLMIGWFVPAIFKGRRFSAASIPLIVFVFYAIIVTLVSIYFSEPPYKSESPLRNSIEALLTLAIGVCFYFAFSWWFTDRQKLAQTIRFINWSGVIILAWTLVQAGAWAVWHQYPSWLRSIHELYSVGPLYRQRVSGFALEPSWFAHQLNMLYLPLWLALTVNRVSAHRWRLFKLSLENILLAGGFVALFLSYSRIGLAAFLLMIAYLVLRFNISLIKWLRQTLLSRKMAFMQRFSSGVLTLLLTLFLILGYAGLIMGVASGLSHVDPRMAKLFVFETNRPDALMYYANQLTFASRLVYWQAGWEVFNQHPWFGVGLGKAGFYLPAFLSAYAWKLVEVRDLVYRSTSILNIKSIWVRLLAETGIVGFSIFIAWLWRLWKAAKSVEADQTDPLVKSMAWMGRFVIIGLVLEGFSVDTFALPYVWVSLGILTASLEMKESGLNAH